MGKEKTASADGPKNRPTQDAYERGCPLSRAASWLWSRPHVAMGCDGLRERPADARGCAAPADRRGLRSRSTGAVPLIYASGVVWPHRATSNDQPSNGPSAGGLPSAPPPPSDALRPSGPRFVSEPSRDAPCPLSRRCRLGPARRLSEPPLADRSAPLRTLDFHVRDGPSSQS